MLLPPQQSPLPATAVVCWPLNIVVIRLIPLCPLPAPSSAVFVEAEMGTATYNPPPFSICAHVSGIRAAARRWRQSTICHSCAGRL